MRVHPCVQSGAELSAAAPRRRPPNDALTGLFRRRISPASSRKKECTSTIMGGPGLPTQSGVCVGDSLEKVKWVYQEREGVTPDDTGYVMGAVALSFVIHDGVVASIEAYISTD